MSASASLSRGGWARSFKAVEAKRTREKGGDLESTAEVEQEEKDGVMDRDKRSGATQQTTIKPVDRREREGASLDAPSPLSRSLELLAIPGVGPRNLRKLVDKGFEGVDQLKQLYIDKV